METLRGRAWCSTSFESVLVYLDEEDQSPFEIRRAVLAACPGFARNAPEEVVNLLLVRIAQGMVLLREDDVGVFTVSPVRAEGFSWDPEANRLAVQLHAVHASLVDGSLRGVTAPVLHAEIGRRYFRTIVGPSLEAALEPRMDLWRAMDVVAAERQISEAIPATLQGLTERFPSMRTHEAVRDGILSGQEPGEIYLDVCRNVIDVARRRIRPPSTTRRVGA